MLEILVALRDVGPWKKNDILAAKPLGQPWGRRELRPAPGKPRSFAIAQLDDPALEASLKGNTKVAPYGDAKIGSNKRADVDALSAQLQSQLADPKAVGRIGTLTLRDKTKSEKDASPVLPKGKETKTK